MSNYGQDCQAGTVRPGNLEGSSAGKAPKHKAHPRAYPKKEDTMVLDVGKLRARQAELVHALAVEVSTVKLTELSNELEHVSRQLESAAGAKTDGKSA